MEARFRNGFAMFSTQSPADVRETVRLRSTRNVRFGWSDLDLCIVGQSNVKRHFVLWKQHIPDIRPDTGRRGPGEAELQQRDQSCPKSRLKIGSPHILEVTLGEGGESCKSPKFLQSSSKATVALGVDICFKSCPFFAPHSLTSAKLSRTSANSRLLDQLLSNNGATLDSPQMSLDSPRDTPSRLNLQLPSRFGVTLVSLLGQRRGVSSGNSHRPI